MNLELINDLIVDASFDFNEQMLHAESKEYRTGYYAGKLHALLIIKSELLDLKETDRQQEMTRVKNLMEQEINRALPDSTIGLDKE